MDPHPLAATHPPEIPPLPTNTTTIKKPRRKAREVSSRYLATPSPSPIPSPSSSPLHPSSSLHHHHPPKHRHTPSVPSSPTDSDSESSRFGDENHPFSCTLSLDTPLPLVPAASNKPLGTTGQRRRAVRLFGDNGDHHHHPQQQQQQQQQPYLRKPRPGTPMAGAVDRILPVATPRGTILGIAQLRAGRSSAAGKGSSRVSTSHPDDTCSENSSTVGDSEVEACSISSQGGFCDSPPITGSRARQQTSEFRSSMPEADRLPSELSRRLLDGPQSRHIDGNENFVSSSSLCSRSLNLALSISQQNPFHQSKPAGRCIPSRICLPPQPPSSKLDVELKKGKKGSNRQEDGHMLRLLHNRYLQWRFTNARAQEVVNARTIAAERSLCGLAAKISEMQSSVVEKRIEVERLRQLRSLSAILELQTPYLDTWSILEGDHSGSLTGLTKALQDASLRLPIAGNVKANTKELKEVFDFTLNIFQSLSPCVQKFVPKALEIEDVMSDLAEIASTERALVEECGNLLAEAHNLQVRECSLRSQLIQAKKEQ